MSSRRRSPRLNKTSKNVDLENLLMNNLAATSSCLPSTSKNSPLAATTIKTYELRKTRSYQKKNLSFNSNSKCKHEVNNPKKNSRNINYNKKSYLKHKQSEETVTRQTRKCVKRLTKSRKSYQNGRESRKQNSHRTNKRKIIRRKSVKPSNQQNQSESAQTLILSNENLSSLTNSNFSTLTPHTLSISSSTISMSSSVSNQIEPSNPLEPSTTATTSNDVTASTSVLPNLNQFQKGDKELMIQLKKATMKFDKACRQLLLLDQHMHDLQNSYSNSLENDRKTFKIVYRMQLATLEGTHNAYIEYIERQVEKIKKLKRLLFNDINQNLSNSQTSDSTQQQSQQPQSVQSVLNIN
jgi:hypothetical protein